VQVRKHKGMPAPGEAKGQTRGMQSRTNQRMPRGGERASLYKREVVQPADLETASSHPQISPK